MTGDSGVPNTREAAVFPRNQPSRCYRDSDSGGGVGFGYPQGSRGHLRWSARGGAKGAPGLLVGRILPGALREAQKVKRRFFFLLAVLAWLLASAPVGAVPLTLPDSSQTTTVSAEVVEQSEILVPAIINFDVTDISQSTASTAVTVQITNIVLSSSNKHITLSVQGGHRVFLPPGPRLQPGAPRT